MYLDLDVKSMIVLYEKGLGNITDDMIFSELERINYDPNEVFNVVVSDKFMRRIDYNVKDNYSNFRKLLITLSLRRKRVKHDIYVMKEIVNNLKQLREDDIDLFKLYYDIMVINKAAFKEYNYDPKSESLEYIIKPIEDSLKNNDKINCFDAGVSITTMIKDFNVSPELSMILLYTISGIDYYASELINYSESGKSPLVDIDKFSSELMKLSRMGIFSFKIDLYIDMMKCIDSLIEDYDPFIRQEGFDPMFNDYLRHKGIVLHTMPSFRHLSRLRDAITRFTIENNL